MKLEGYVLLGVAAFVFVLSAIYWFLTYEDAGSVLLVTTAVMFTIPGAYLVLTSRRHPPRLEDQPDAVIADGAGRIGSFPASSIWPLALAAGLVLMGVGTVFGVWFGLPGALLVLVALGAAVVEGRRGPEPGRATGDFDGP